MYSEINFSTAAEPRLFLTTLSSFVKEQQMAHYGAIIICRSGKANIQVTFDDWQLFEGAVITISVKEIAWEYHFNDVSFFCRYFKRHTGLTPMEIRTVGNG